MEYTNNIENKIESFIKVGIFLNHFLKNNRTGLSNKENIMVEKLQKIMNNEHIYNGWFTEPNLEYALTALQKMLSEKNLTQWLRPYMSSIGKPKNPKKIGVIMPGNIPLVGFHDFLCVILSGNIFIGKLSSDDKHLLPMIADIICHYEPQLKNKIFFTEEKIPGSDAYIATGSDNTSRYFEYYFGKYPNIIRKNRNSVAILDGSETMDELSLLADDIMLYFGMGCRSISKLFVPKNYDFSQFFQSIEKYQHYKNHKKYANNYDYYKAIFLINKESFLDNVFLMLKEETRLSTPIACLNYEVYTDEKMVIRNIEEHKNQIQCIVAKRPVISTILPFGKAQQPELWDYADGIDTMNFLTTV